MNSDSEASLSNKHHLKNRLFLEKNKNREVLISEECQDYQVNIYICSLHKKIDKKKLVKSVN